MHMYIKIYTFKYKYKYNIPYISEYLKTLSCCSDECLININFIEI